MDHLEDFLEDIISKAQDGLKITNRTLAEKSGLDLSEIKTLKNGQSTQRIISRIAPLLDLDTEKLMASANQSWHPATPQPGELHTFVSHFRDMSVNSFLLHTPGDQEALLFDTGVDPEPVLDYCKKKNCSLRAILLTHGHPDHIAVLPQLREAFPSAKCFGHPLEKIPNSEAIRWGEQWSMGKWMLQNIETPGHTPGGTSYLIRNVSQPFCFVGDAIFAGSVGGCAADYKRALLSIEKNILSTLNPKTILCPGHGPITSVEQEIKHNPFF